MSDLFHKSVPTDFIESVFRVMNEASRHTFLGFNQASGPRARPMEADRVREIRDNYLRNNVPFFFKQWGGVFKKKNGTHIGR